MKKYFAIIIVGLLAMAGLALSYFSGSFSYELETAGKPSFEAAEAPKNEKADKDILKSVNIILSPHFDDAVLSLGGFLAKDQAEIEVNTFFVGKPSKNFYTKWDEMSDFYDSNEAVAMRTIENKNALGEFGVKSRNYDYLDFQYREKGQDNSIEKNIEKDIETIISRYPSREISIYGPADFGSEITDPDHKILHEVFIAEAKKNKNPDIKFFIYEDFPYARQFDQSNSGNLKNYLEANSGIEIEESDIEIKEDELVKKNKGVGVYISQVTAYRAQGTDIAALSDNFSRERCKADHPDWYACEVVYKILE